MTSWLYSVPAVHKCQVAPQITTDSIHIRYSFKLLPPGDVFSEMGSLNNPWGEWGFSLYWHFIQRLPSALHSSVQCILLYTQHHEAFSQMENYWKLLCNHSNQYKHLLIIMNYICFLLNQGFLLDSLPLKWDRYFVPKRR
jgi:hypothetical protein